MAREMRRYCEERTRLETVIPLSTPFIVHVDPCDTCNFHCKFCPTGRRDIMRNVRGRNHGPMDFELFRKIVNDIRLFDNPLKTLRFYKDGEPLLNRRLPDMVALAMDSGRCETVDTVTNASLLTKEMADGLIEAGLSRINISVEGISAEKYREFSGYEINFERFVDNIRYFFENRRQCTVFVKICGDILNEDEVSKFRETFSPISDGIAIEHLGNVWPNFDLGGLTCNKDLDVYGNKITARMVCPEIFYKTFVNTDATVSPCTVDWSRSMIVGDLKKETLPEVWNGAKLNSLRRFMLRGQRKMHPVCSGCGHMSQGATENIDSHADELLKKIPAEND